MKKLITLIAITSTLLLGDSVVQHSSKIVLDGKPVIYIFDSSTCPYCEKLKKELDELPQLNKIAKEFNIYSIPRDEPTIYDIFGKKVSTQELQLSYRVKVTPNVVILNKKAKKMFQTSGYIGPIALTKMMQFVKGVDDGKYKTSQWSEFLYNSNVTTSKESKPKSLAH